jgi:hypothetical protein
MCLEDWVNLNGLQNPKEEKEAGIKSILKSSDQVVIGVHMVVMCVYQMARCKVRGVQSLGLHMGKLHLCLVCDPANDNWLKKSQNMPVWLNKMVLAQHFCVQLVQAGKRHSKH